MVKSSGIYCGVAITPAIVLRGTSPIRTGDVALEMWLKVEKRGRLWEKRSMARLVDMGVWLYFILITYGFCVLSVMFGVRVMVCIGLLVEAW